VCFSRWGIENFYIVFPYSLKERVKWIFQWLSKNAIAQITVSLDAPAPSLSLSQTTSDIRFRDKNLALLCTDIADCWTQEYSVWLIIMKLEQVVMHQNAVLFQLVYSPTIYRSVCLFGIISPVEFAKEAFHYP
jgi:hypothetical protein